MLQPSVPLCPKDPSAGLRVVLIGRISTEHQNKENIEASYRYVEAHLRQLFAGKMQIKRLGERASGMLVDRRTIREAEDLIATGEWDLVIAEDLSRIFRNPRHQYNFVQDAFDSGTRLICIADNLDTADDQWELMLGAATLRHGLVVSDTRRRVRRTATHAFHQGGMVQKVKFGYRRLSREEATSGDFGPKGLAIAKRPECTATILEMVRRVLRRDTYVAIADWATDEGIEPPPYATTGRWTARLIRQLLEDPILSGRRTFRKTVFEPVFRTGRHKRRPNPQPETSEYPALAHLSRQDHDAVREAIEQRRSDRMSRSGRAHPLHGRPRSRTIWPAQHVRCGICGGLMYRYDRDQLKCSGARLRGDDACWNHVQLDCELARRRILAWLLEVLSTFPSFLPTLRESARAEWHRAGQRARSPDANLAREITSLENQSQNLTRAIATGGELEPLVHRLRGLQHELEAARTRRDRLVRQKRQQRAEEFPELTADHIAVLVHEIARGSYEFGDLMRHVVPKFDILPIQTLDTGLVRPRAHLQVRLDNLADSTDSSCSGRSAPFEVSLDLFEPPLHIRHLPACVARRQQSPRLSLKQIAAEVGVSHMTVKRAMDYRRLMDREGLTEPYRVLREKPQHASRWNSRR